MKHSGLLFLVIALLHSPHERNCVKIMLDGFEPKTPKSRNCKSNVYTTGRIILDEGETLENLPQSIIIHFKCPYYTQRPNAHLLGREDGGWIWLWTAPFNSCAPPETPYPHWNCTHSEGRSYRITTMQTPYYAMKYCRMRLFFVNLLTDDQGSFIPKDHGWIGLSREVVFKEFIGVSCDALDKWNCRSPSPPLKLSIKEVNKIIHEAPYYDTIHDAWCNRRVPPKAFGSKNGAPYIRPATDILLMFCGITMANAVLSF